MDSAEEARWKKILESAELARRQRSNMERAEAEEKAYLETRASAAAAEKERVRKEIEFLRKEASSLAMGPGPITSPRSVSSESDRTTAEKSAGARSSSWLSRVPTAAEKPTGSSGTGISPKPDLSPRNSSMFSTDGKNITVSVEILIALLRTVGGQITLDAFDLMNSNGHIEAYTIQDPYALVIKLKENDD